MGSPFEIIEDDEQRERLGLIGASIAPWASLNICRIFSSAAGSSCLRLEVSLPVSKWTK